MSIFNTITAGNEEQASQTGVLNHLIDNNVQYSLYEFSSTYPQIKEKISYAINREREYLSTLKSLFQKLDPIADRNNDYDDLFRTFSDPIELHQIASPHASPQSVNRYLQYNHTNTTTDSGHNKHKSTHKHTHIQTANTSNYHSFFSDTQGFSDTHRGKVGSGEHSAFSPPKSEEYLIKQTSLQT